MPNPGSIAYGAAKAGLHQPHEDARRRVRTRGTRGRASPSGCVRTEQAHLFYGDEEGIAAVGATMPIGRMAEPSDIGDVCLFLASPLARYVTGEQLVVHGGGELPAYLDAAHNTST